jgi:hypothetical protein
MAVGCRSIVGCRLSEERSEERKRAVPVINGRFPGVRAGLQLSGMIVAINWTRCERILSEFVVARGDSSVMFDFVDYFFVPAR